MPEKRYIVMIQTVMTNKKTTLGSCVVLGLGSLRPLSERKREQASVGKFLQEMDRNPQPLYYSQAKQFRNPLHHDECLSKTTYRQ